MELVQAWTEIVPPAWTGAWILLFGLVVGSFLNVVVHRVPRGASVVTPRSRCPRCGRLIRWHENVPVLSWLVLRGRCAGCDEGIAWRYPAMELLTGLLFLGAFVRFGLGPTLVAAMALIAASLALIAIDAELFLLPDAITLPMTWLGLALSWGSELTEPRSALFGILLAVALIEGLNFSYRLVRGRDGLGAGDTKMLMMVAAFLGWDLMVVTLCAACILGLLIGIPLLAWARWHARRAGGDEAAQRADDTVGESADGADASDDDASDDGGEDAPSALRELVPPRAADLIAPLLFAALLLSYLVPWTSPERAAAGLLVGVLLAFAHRRIAHRLGAGPSRGGDLWALALALLGLPPSAVSALVAGGVVLACLALARPVDRFLRRVSPHAAPLSPLGDVPGDVPGDIPGDEADAALAAQDPPDAGPPETGPGLMEAALPLGVFLGVAAILALFWGVDAIEWYLEASRVLGG